MTIKAQQIEDAILILTMSIEKAQMSTDERAARAVEAMKDIKACCELQDFFNSFAGATQADCEFNSERDEYYTAAARYLESRLADPDYARQLRFIVENQTANTI